MAELQSPQSPKAEICLAVKMVDVSCRAHAGDRLDAQPAAKFWLACEVKLHPGRFQCARMGLGWGCQGIPLIADATLSSSRLASKSQDPLTDPKLLNPQQGGLNSRDRESLLAFRPPEALSP